MSGYNNNSDDYSFLDEGEQSRGGGGLRKVLEEALAENKKLRQAIEGDQREKSTAALLKEKGLDPAIAELIPEEQDASAWVEKYAHLLGIPQNTPNDEPAVEPDVQASDDSDPAIVLRKQQLAEEQRALAEMQDAAESGYPPEVAQDLISKIQNTNSEEEFMKLLKENGALGG